MNATDERRASRLWVWYALAWLPLGAFLRGTDGAHAADDRRRSVGAGLRRTSLPVAMLGIRDLVAHAARRVAAAQHVRASSPFTSSVTAVVRAASGSASRSRSSRSRPDIRLALEISSIFAGFQALDGVFFYGLIAAGSYVDSHRAVASASRKRAPRAPKPLRMRAELAALRGQLNPHFLFNTLHTLTALVRRDPGHRRARARALRRHAALRARRQTLGAGRRDACRRDAVRPQLSVARAASARRPAARRRAARSRRARLRACRRSRCSRWSRTRSSTASRRGRAAARSRSRRRFDDESLVLEVRDDGAGRGERRDRQRRRAWACAPCASVSRRAIRGRARLRGHDRAGRRLRRARHSPGAHQLELLARTRARSGMKTRAVVVEDEPIARHQLRDLLADVDWIECVGEAADGRTAVRADRRAQARISSFSTSRCPS